MSEITISFDDILDHLDLLPDAHAELPPARVELTVVWHRPEPDVGVMRRQCEVTDRTFYLGDRRMVDQGEFARALHAVIAPSIRDDANEIFDMITARIDNELADAEDGQ